MMQTLDTANRISYKKYIREMGATELILEYNKLQAERYKPEISGYLEIIEKCYLQITGESIQKFLNQ